MWGPLQILRGCLVCFVELRFFFFFFRFCGSTEICRCGVVCCCLDRYQSIVRLCVVILGLDKIPLVPIAGHQRISGQVFEVQFSHVEFLMAKPKNA